MENRNRVSKCAVVAEALLALPLLVAVSCAQESTGAGPGEPARAAVEREMKPDATAAEIERQAGDERAFGFDLYQELRMEGGDAAQGNLFCSPYSISVALAMTYAGARGETAAQMAKALHFTLPPARFHPAMNALDLKLTPQESAAGKRSPFMLHIVNRLWGQTGETFLPEFLELVARNYGAGLHLLDFARQPDESRHTINGWVAQQTNEKIKDLLPAGAIERRTKLVLTNAVYFKAEWEQQFEKRRTQDQPFHLLDGQTVPVPMMTETHNWRYGAGDGWQAIELPYVGGQFAMLIFVPDTGRFATFDEDWGVKRYDDVVGGLKSQSVWLRLPKFTFSSEFTLKKALSALGMPLAFGAADFSAMDGKRDLFIADAYHKAFVQVDETGTEAAAATAVGIKATAMPHRPVELTIDRPFLFVIRHVESGAVLFVGRVVDPRA